MKKMLGMKNIIIGLVLAITATIILSVTGFPPALGGIYAADEQSVGGSWHDVYMHDGDTYDVSTASANTTINEDGSFTLKGKSSHVRVIVNSKKADIYLADGLSIDPGITTNVGVRTAAISTVDNGRTVKLISKPGAKVTRATDEASVMYNGEVKSGESGTLYKTAIVSFDSNKPSNASTDIAGTMAEQTVKHENTNLSPLGYSLPGYDFKEWNTEKDGTGTSYSDGATVNGSILKTNTVLYAQWQPKTYTVTFDANGGLGEAVSQTLHFDQHEKLKLNTYEKEGLYTFIGWTGGAFGSQHLFENGDTVCNISTLNPDGSVSDKTLVAQWIHDGYTVVLVTDNDEGVKDLVEDNPRRLRLRQNDSEYSGFEESGTVQGLYILEDTIGELPSGEYDIIIDGYDTGGEKVTKEGSAFLEYCTVEMNDADLEGKAWLIDSYDNRVKKIEKVLEGRSIAIEASTARGYKFESYTAIGVAPSTWNPTEANQSIEVGGELLLEAHSVPNSYYIEFNSNGAEHGLMPEQKCNFDEPAKLPACEFNFKDHHFTGWNTSADGSGTAYTDCQEIIDLTDEEGAIVMLYAQWEADTYTIKYDANGGKGEMPEQIVNRGVPETIATNAFEKEGYDFTSWSTKAKGTGTSYKAGALAINLADTNETITLYAQWTKKGSGGGSDDGSNAGVDKGADTGDKTNPLAAFVILLISILGSIVAVVYRKKKTAI